MTAEELLELIRSRRSTRAFHSGRELSDEQLELLLEGARWAPTAGNVQPWRFFVVGDATLKKRLAEAAWNQGFVRQAPVVIVVCVRLDDAQSSYGPRGETLYCLQDTAAAVQNILLLAETMGLATCWVGAFDERKVASALKLSEQLRPVALIPVGYPAEEPVHPPRKSLGTIVEYMK